MRKPNIIIFSSGESEANGTLGRINTELEQIGYNCFCWRELFYNANNIDNIALMPMLIKKIPTFDYALLIGEGHDKTTMVRNRATVEVNSMRDNVLFEIGLCTMALGMQKVILLTDSKVHLPEDLVGKQGSIAIKHIVINHSANSETELSETNRVAQEINTYILSDKGRTSPIVIGAAAATAVGYATNFILRTAEHITDGFYDKTDPQKTVIRYPMSDIYFKIILPETYDEGSPQRARAESQKYRSGVLETARSRAAEFKFEEKSGKLFIVDYPTTLVTSYDTAKIILNMDADDTSDDRAQSRFTEKELDLFEATLNNIISNSFIRQQTEHFYSHLDEKQRESMANELSEFFENNFAIIRENY